MEEHTGTGKGCIYLKNWLGHGLSSETVPKFSFYHRSGGIRQLLEGYLAFSAAQAAASTL